MSQTFDESYEPEPGDDEPGALLEGASSDLEQDVVVSEVESGLESAADDAEAVQTDVDDVLEDAEVDGTLAEDAEQSVVSDPEADALVEDAEGEVSAAVDATTDAAEAAADEESGGDGEAVPDPMQEFRDALYAKPGDWYVVHTYSGMEKRVKTNLENRINSLNMEDFIYEVIVPTEEYSEVKNGQIKKGTRTTLPGYVLVNMELTDESWAAVRHTPSVTGFVGHAHQPVPLSMTEVENMLAPAVQAQAAAQAVATAEPGDAAAAPRQPKVEFTDFGTGDAVMVIEGPFATLHATITEINVDAQRVKALVEIFGRETPVELGFAQIQRI